jgi:hypothetical protein
MGPIGRPAGDDQAAECEQRRDHIGDALQRIGEDRRGSGQLIRGVFAPEQYGADRHGEQRGAYTRTMLLGWRRHAAHCDAFPRAEKVR